MKYEMAKKRAAELHPEFEFVDYKYADGCRGTVVFRCHRCAGTFSRSEKVLFPSYSKRLSCPRCSGNIHKPLTPDEIQARIDKFYDAAFIYLGGYDGDGSDLELECVFCGKHFTRSSQILRPAYRANVWCPDCRPELLGQARSAHEDAVNRFNADDNGWTVLYSETLTGKGGMRHRIRCEVCGYERWATSLGSAPECYGCKRIKDAEDRWDAGNHVNVCEVCGTEFVTRRPWSKFCSDKCRSFAKSRKRHERDKIVWGSDPRRTKLMANGPYDSTINLYGLFVRDGGVCKLCGGRCDWESYRLNENGHFVCGDYYPTCDHIIPVCEGGLHQWDNVQLAHFRCNYERGATDILLT